VLFFEIHITVILSVASKSFSPKPPTKPRGLGEKDLRSFGLRLLWKTSPLRFATVR
jgi:hypothetical protein